MEVGKNFTCMKNSIPTAMVVPKANPKANKVAANAANPKGTTGGGSLLAALMSILTVFHPKESCKQLRMHMWNAYGGSHCWEKWLTTTPASQATRWIMHLLYKDQDWVWISSIHTNVPWHSGPPILPESGRPTQGIPRESWLATLREDLIILFQPLSSMERSCLNGKSGEPLRNTPDDSLGLPHPCTHPSPYAHTHVNMHAHTKTTHGGK